MVYTKSISRFARNTVDCLNAIRKLKVLGIAVIFEKESINTLDSKGEVLITIMASLSQAESSSLSQNVAIGVRYRMAEGHGTLNYNRFLGYTKSQDGKLVVVPEEAEVVRRIFREYLEGFSTKAIVRHLNEDHIRTPTGKDAWHPSTITSMLENEKFCGDLSPGQPLVRKRETLSEPQPVVQATPPIEKTTPPVLSSMEEAAPPPKPAEEMKGEAVKKSEAVKIAHSHSARVQLIRSFITTQLAAHGGRMKSGELFKALISIPDYRFDQQRSRRKPLDYLETQYSAWFLLTPGENGSYWISLRSVADSHTEQQPVADEQPTESPVDDVADEQPAVIDEHLSAAEKETADEQPGEGQPAAEEPAAPPLPDDPRVALIEVGILVQDADLVAAILSESKNLLSAYNGLAKAFGRKQGSQYYRMVKERFETPSAVQTEVTTPSTEEETEQHTQDEQEQPHAEEPQAEATLERFLVDHDVEAAAQIASIVSSSASLRITYNELRKAFGATDGRAYLALVKEFRA